LSGTSLQGALLIDKPAGPTSHDVVAFVRRALRVDRAGHTGTLDPLATGLLVVLVGSATRLAQFLAADEKEYIADVRLGIATVTYDAASLPDAGVQVREWRMEVGTSVEDIEQTLSRFRGTFLQTPPPYSAKKIASVPAYEKARKNQSVELKPVEVTVRELEIVRTSNLETGSPTPSPAALHPSTSSPPLRLRVAASAGFYVRSLAHDIGQALGCGAHLEALRRTRVGRFRAEDGLTLDRVESEGVARLTSPNDLLGHMPAVTLTEEGARRVFHGNPISDPASAVDKVRLLDPTGALLAIAEPRRGGLLQPVVVLR
jgi:tRNA pseudouridine55 synthase